MASGKSDAASEAVRSPADRTESQADELAVRRALAALHGDIDEHLDREMRPRRRARARRGSTDRDGATS